ncbi:MAG: hypothetical protein OXB95_05815, partial [Rhodobacteraceae bacterium]|nr:hypothetical protein [Paracoccaceae bacterium]
ATIAVEAEHGTLLGLVDAQVLSRSAGQKQSRGRPLADRPEGTEVLVRSAHNRVLDGDGGQALCESGGQARGRAQR